mgnify:CR=1 FL=1
MIKITTDSTCDLPVELLEQHHISVIPLGIVKGDRGYRCPCGCRRRHHYHQRGKHCRL